MSTWNYKGENGSGLAAGTNANAKVVGNAPYWQADNLASKRNVILTNQGWVRRLNTQDLNGNRRKREEIVVAAHPADGNANTGYLSNTHAGFPDVQQIYLTTAANVEHTTVLSNGNISITGGAAAVHAHVVFNEPVVSGNAATIVATATSSGSNETFTSVPSEGAHGGNNIIVFKSAGTVAVGTYQIKAQTIGGTNPIENVEFAGTDQGTDRRFANLVISGAATTTLAAGSANFTNNFTIAS